MSLDDDFNATDAQPLTGEERWELEQEALDAAGRQTVHSRAGPMSILPPAVERRGNATAIASLIIGAVSALGSLLPLAGLLVLPLAGAGALFALHGLSVCIRRGGQGLAYALAGLVLNIFALCVGGLVTLGCIARFL